MQRKCLHTDIAQNACFFEDFIADERTSWHPDYGEFVLNATGTLQALDLV